MRLSPDPCPSEHPFTLIDDIQGRVEDVLSFPGAAGGAVIIQPLVFSRIMDTLPVSGWQVVQEADGLHVLLNGVRGPFGDEMLTATLQRALAEQGAIAPHMEVQQVDSIPKTAAGKAPHDYALVRHFLGTGLGLRTTSYRGADLTVAPDLRPGAFPPSQHC